MSRDDFPAGVIVALFIGEPEALWPGKPESAIAKRPVSGPLMLNKNGFAGDVQADCAVHGGPEKAVHQYPVEHMELWKQEMPDIAHKFTSGCFGENVSTSGLDEDNVCLGDIVQMGTARLQVLQGRQPCWKLNAHIGVETMAHRFRQTARTGWYYRVLENGVVSVGDPVAVQERVCPQWPLSRLITTFFGKKIDPGCAKSLANTPSLSLAWREAFSARSNQLDS